MKKLLTVIVAVTTLYAHARQQHIKPHPKFNSTQTNNNITVQAQTIDTEAACQELFGPNGAYLLNKQQPVVPLHITITNNSDQTYLLDQDMIDLKLVNGKKVRSMLGKNTFGRMATTIGLGLVVGAAAFWATGFAIMYAAGGAAGCGLVAMLGGMAVSGSIFLTSMIATPVVGYKSYKSNCVLEHEMAQKSPVEGLVIAPGNQQSMFIFVQRKNLPESFQLTLANEDQESITFDISAGKSVEVNAYEIPQEIK